MSQLAVLRSRLHSLRTARAAVQWGGALAATVSGTLALGLAAWGLDVLFRWDRGSRAVILAAWFAALVMMLHRWIGPLLRRRESLEHVALWVERQHRLDGDLVSALQFEQPTATAWGSPRLTSAVIEYVADFSRGLNVFVGFTWETLPRRLAMLVATTVLIVGLWAVRPAEAAVFWNRFWLGSARYPTRTVLAEIVINGRSIDPFPTTPTTVAIAQDEPLAVQLRTSGEAPVTATVVVRGQRSGERGVFPMAASEGDYRYEQPSLTESLRLWIRAGDAESDPITVAVVPLPVVELQWTVEPPSYTGSASRTDISAGTRSFAVLAGSRLRCTVSSANKQLKEVRFVVDGESIPLTPLKNEAFWSIPAHPRLEGLQQPLTYELAVVDEDGLSPQPPIVGEIRLQTDRPPRVSAAAVSRKVLPQAKPRLTYGATDDFGLGELRLEWEVISESGQRRSARRVLRPRTAQRSEAVARGETVFDLSTLNVAAGDEVRVVVAADDERGDLAPQTGRSDPVIFAVTDKAGILDSLLEIDQQSAQQLDAIIEKELGIGGTR